MPKIYFEGREYDDPEQMTPEARARYEKAVKMLPDRDSNGIPDLLEGDGIPAVTPPPVKKPVVDSGPPGLGVPADTPLTRKDALAAAKNRRWILWLVIGIISLCIACFGIIMVGIFAIMRSSEAYQLAVETAKNYPAVQQALGVPIQDGIFATGSVEENGSSGSADLKIPLSGPNQSGKLYVTAVKEENTWRLTYLLLEVGGQEYQLVP
jgi:hypothetical protein